MRLSDLAAYAEEKYHIKEQHKWADFPGFSVLADPSSGKWAALLMRKWDQDLGEEVERCDIKCGQDILAGESAAYLSKPFRMHGPKWVGVTFDMLTDADVVKDLFDKAMSSGRPGFVIELDSKEDADGTPVLITASELLNRKTQESPGPSAPEQNTGYADTDIPDKIREMIRLYDYGDGSFRQKCLNFYNQGMLMKDYTDDAPWYGELRRYFPTYHDLNLKQLRGYFTWRKDVRSGSYQKTCSSYAYIYIYELLNGIGVSSSEESLEKLTAFKENYLDTGLGDPSMKSNLRRWMMEFSVVNNLPQDVIDRYRDREAAKRDAFLSTLRNAENHSDDEVFDALMTFADSKTAASPVITKAGARGRHLFSEVWRLASKAVVHAEGSVSDGKELFAACFGELKVLPWHPLSAAVYFDHSECRDMEYEFSGCRKYICRDGVWSEEMIDSSSAGRTTFRTFIRALDLKLRRALSTARYLKERAEEAWAYALIDTALAEIKRAEFEASRPKISINLSGLGKIREDAEITRDSLLTEEEMDEPEAPAESSVDPQDAADQQDAASEQYVAAEPEAEEEQTEYTGLDPVLLAILRALLGGASPDGIIQEHQLMPSVVADSINEALWDDIGDSVIECEGEELQLVEDYIEDLELLIGGNNG